jgi:hypothetical protein
MDSDESAITLPIVGAKRRSGSSFLDWSGFLSTFEDARC